MKKCFIYKTSRKKIGYPSRAFIDIDSSQQRLKLIINISQSDKRKFLVFLFDKISFFLIESGFYEYKKHGKYLGKEGGVV